MSLMTGAGVYVIIATRLSQTEARAQAVSCDWWHGDVGKPEGEATCSHPFDLSLLRPLPSPSPEPTVTVWRHC
jgi:hypothetical protein